MLRVIDYIRNLLGYKTDTDAINSVGSDVLNQLIIPAFKSHPFYYRVTSFYSSASLLHLIDQLSQSWLNKGKVKILIGYNYYESELLSDVLNLNNKTPQNIQEAISLALNGKSKEIKTILKQRESNLVVLKELIDRDAIEIRLVFPRGESLSNNSPIFHSKFSIFSDIDIDIEYLRNLDTSNTSLVIGSFNETARGYGKNIESAIRIDSSSSERDKGRVLYFLESFYSLWHDQTDYAQSMPFTVEFKKIIEKVEEKLAPNVNIPEKQLFTLNNFKDLLNTSSVYHPFSFKNINLLPHQYRVYVQTLSKEQIRGILADEVGLGKTIEAGSIISYLNKFKEIKKILILTPANLTSQWQSELSEHFDEYFYIYRDKKLIGLDENDQISFDVKNPTKINQEKLIISWHLIRQNSSHKKTIDFIKSFDLIIVDEAHHARKRDEESSTNFFKLLNEIKETTNFLLLTATPLQTSIQDLKSLLELIGYSEHFDFNYFKKLAEGELSRSSFNISQRTIIAKSLSNYYNIPITLNPDDSVSLEEFMRVIPLKLLLVRNTRESLRKAKYEFPDVMLKGVNIKINEQQKKILENIEIYTQNSYGSVEQLLFGNKNMGFMKSGFRQRIISSFKAAEDTLENRRVFLEKLLKGKTEAINDMKNQINSEYVTSDLIISSDKEILNILKSESNKIKRESDWIKDLIKDIKTSLLDFKDIQDPKFLELSKLINQYKKSRSIVAFSRYVSTTEYIISQLGNAEPELLIGRFDGGSRCLYKNNKIIKNYKTKQEFVKDFKDNKFKIVICSDAASEGLNLQCASVLINVDVPWNPARLIQRNGRIDRFGQKEKTIYIYNLYYEDSYESKMYARLEDRLNSIRIFTGSVSDIIDKNIKKTLSKWREDNIPDLSSIGDDIIRNRKLQDADELMISKLELVEIPVFLYLLKSVLKFFKIKYIENKREYLILVENKEYKISREMTNENFLNFYHPILKEIKVENTIDENCLPILTLKVNDFDSMLYILDSKYLYPLSSNYFSLLLDAVILGEPIALTKLEKIENNEDSLEKMICFFREKEKYYWPDHSYMSFLNITNRIHQEKYSEGNILGYLPIK